MWPIGRHEPRLHGQETRRQIKTKVIPNFNDTRDHFFVVVVLFLHGKLTDWLQGRLPSPHGIFGSDSQYRSSRVIQFGFPWLQSSISLYTRAAAENERAGLDMKLPGDNNGTEPEIDRRESKDLAWEEFRSKSTERFMEQSATALYSLYSTRRRVHIRKWEKSNKFPIYRLSPYSSFVTSLKMLVNEI